MFECWKWIGAFQSTTFIQHKIQSDSLQDILISVSEDWFFVHHSHPLCKAFSKVITFLDLISFQLATISLQTFSRHSIILLASYHYTVASLNWSGTCVWVYSSWRIRDRGETLVSWSVLGLSGRTWCVSEKSWMSAPQSSSHWNLYTPEPPPHKLPSVRVGR